MNHFYCDEQNLKNLHHPHIVKVHESKRDVQIDLPSYVRKRVSASSKAELELLNEVQGLKPNSVLSLDQMKHIYARATCLKPCSYIVMDFA